MLATYEQDSALIDRIIVLNAGLSGDIQIIKQAGITDYLGGLANEIKANVADRIEKEGVLGTLATYLITMVAFRKNFFLGAILNIADQFGYSPGAMFKWAYIQVMNIIKQNGMFTPEDADRVADEASKQLSVQASLEPLHELQKQGKLSWVIQGRGFEDKLGFEKSAGILSTLNIFKYFGKGKTTLALLGGFFKWMLKTVLMGFAAVEGTKLVTGLGKQPSGGEQVDNIAATSLTGVPTFLNTMFGTNPETKHYQTVQELNFPISKNNLKSSGAGQKYFINGPNNQWWVKVPNEDVRSAMVQWAVKIYPELAGHQAEIKQSKSFDRMASILEQGNKMKGWIKVPPSNLHSWQDIVDTFAAEVEMIINQKKGV